MRKKILVIIFLFFILGSNIFAAEGGGNIGGGGGVSSGEGLYNPISANSISDIFQAIISFLIKIGVPITAIMVLYGGYLILTAGDKSEQISKGRMAILYAAVGYAIVLSAWGVIAIIKEILNTQ